jgi:ATP-binding cassette subfamily B protein/subfamily B ATP-binding cassette protein MsbA
VARKLLPYLRPHRWQIAWVLAQILLITGFELFKPWPLQVVIDNVLGGKPSHFAVLAGASKGSLLLFACLGIVAVHLGSGALTLSHNYTAILVGQRMVNDLRGALYAHLQRLSLAYHGRQRVGDLLYRITSDSFAVQTLIMNGLLPIASAAILLVGILVVLWPLDPVLTLLSLAVVPVLFGLISGFNRKIVDVAGEVRSSESRVYSLVQSAIASIKIIQAFTKEEEEHRRFMGASRESLRATLRLYSWQTFYAGSVNAVIAAGTALVVYAGAHAVLSGALTVGQLIVFVSYLAQLYAPINTMTQSWGLIAGARAGARRVFEVLDTAPDLVDGTRSFPPKGARGAVAWRRVDFAYRRELPVLRGIDLEAEAGARIAIVGPTGAGKSTLLSLLPRFYDPTAGAVEIDGIDIRLYRLESLRRQIALVLQPPMIFPLSVRDNIAYGRPGADQAAIARAARLAGIDGLIEALPEGWDTLIGESGAALSEGEKQRVTIARALLRDAPILILDEPTSALDVATEALVMAGIERLMDGRTTFIIAHRLSTVRRCERIAVLQEGRIVEAGSLPELLRRGGVFAEYYRSQFALQEEAAPAGA